MAKFTFTFDIESEEIPEAMEAVRDIIEDFAFPEYQIQVDHEGGASETIVGGEKRGIVSLPPVDSGFGAWVEEALPGWALDDEEDDETDPNIDCSCMPGDVVEIAGLVYQVFSADVTGRVVLDVLPELDLNDEGERLH